ILARGPESITTTGSMDSGLIASRCPGMTRYCLLPAGLLLGGFGNQRGLAAVGQLVLVGDEALGDAAATRHRSGAQLLVIAHAGVLHALALRRAREGQQGRGRRQ